MRAVPVETRRPQVTGYLLGCTGKRSYGSATQAHHALAQLKRRCHRVPRTRQVYACPMCGSWHLSSWTREP